MMQQHKGIRVILLTLALAGVTLLVVRWSGLGSLFGKGSSSIERWCGEQVKLIASDLLGPELTFDDFDYEFPGTLTLRNTRLTDGDVVCLEASLMRLVLRDVPARGKPIVIDTVELTGLVMHLVVRDDGTLAGFTNFIKPSSGRKHANGGSSRPSDFLAIRKMTIKDGVVQWTNANGTTMELDDLEFDLNGQPDAAPGWYTLDASLIRVPIMKLLMSGRFQLDQFVFDLSELALDIVLNKETRKNLPPALQSLLAKYELQGQLVITGKATVPFPDPVSSTLNLKLALTSAHLATDRIQVPLDGLTMVLALSDQYLSADSIQIDVFGGHVEGNGSIDFAKALYSKLKLTGHDLRLERALKETTKFESNLSGAVTLDGSASATLRKFPTDLDGSGHISIKDGQLWGDSLYRGLMEEAGQTDTGKDSGSTDFSLRPDRVEFKKLLVVGGTTAAHGEGELLFNNRINFRFNAGVIERIEESLGSIGDVLELMTDRVVKYQVTGTWAKPEFNIRPLGLGADAEKVDPPN